MAGYRKWAPSAAAGEEEDVRKKTVLPAQPLEEGMLDLQLTEVQLLHQEGLQRPQRLHHWFQLAS